MVWWTLRNDPFRMMTGAWWRDLLRPLWTAIRIKIKWGTWGMGESSPNTNRNHRMYVVLTPWVSELINIPPTRAMKDLIVPDARNNLLPSIRLSPDAKRLALQISDLILFDFLVDDHDRREGKNWIAIPRPSALSSSLDLIPSLASLEAERQFSILQSVDYLFWDNGLSWDHGPFGLKLFCNEILCGR